MKINVINRFKPSQLAAGAALLLVIVVTLWITQRHDNTDLALQSESNSDSTPLALQWRAGSAQAYQMQFDSSMRMNIPGNASQAMQVQMQGVLNITTLEVGQPGEALVGMQLADVSLWVNDQSDPATNDAISAPFRVRFVSGGVPSAFEFPAQVSAQQRAMLENIIRTFQITMGDTQRWSARESNASGNFLADYQRSAAQHVEKTKRNFSSLPEAAMLAGASISSKESFRLDSQHDWVADMVVNETLNMPGPAGSPTMNVINQATLSVLPNAQIAARNTWNFIAAAPLVDDESAAPIPIMSVQEARRQILATVPELNFTQKGRITLIHRLRDLLKVDPSLPAVLLQQLKTEELTDRTRADIYLVFELAGTEAAQTALVSVIDDPSWSARDAMRAIVALGGIDEPTEQTLNALWLTAQTTGAHPERQQLVSTAKFALGAIGNTLHKSQSPEYDALKNQLLDGAFSSAGSEHFAEERANYIHALGNTSDPSLANDLRPFLNDKAPSVRRAVALSLGRMGTDQSGNELIAQLKKESNSQVRAAIAESLITWKDPTPASVSDIRSAITTERDDLARLNMALFLGASAEKFPENEVVLQQLMRTEKSNRVRQQVAEILAELK